MSRAKDAITKAAAARGLVVRTMDWEPAYNAGEMQGICGGWTVTWQDDLCEPIYGGGSAAEVVAWINAGLSDPGLTRRPGAA